MTAAMKYTQPLRLDTLLNEQKSIYVRNKRNGIIVISASESNGRPVRIVIPKTKHPFCLSERFTRYSLEHSQSLKQSLAGGSVELLDPVRAEQELNHPGVREQLTVAISRVSNRASEVTNYRGQKGGLTTAVGDGDVTAQSFGEAKASKMAEINPHSSITDASPGEDNDFNDFSTGINTRVVTICGLVASRDLAPKEALIELNGMIEDLTNDDLDHITTNSNERLQTWAQNVLAQRMGKNVPAELLEPDVAITEEERKAAEDAEDAVTSDE